MTTATSPQVVRYDLSIDEIRENTRLHSPALVAEVFAQARSVVAEEAARSSRLDAKANALLSAIGLIGALVAVLHRLDLHGAVLVFCAIGAVSALVSVACAVVALHIAEHARVPDVALFDPVILDQADAKKDGGVAEYQRWLLPALWASHQRTCAVNDGKARKIWIGQVAFFCAIAVPVLGSAALSVLR